MEGFRGKRMADQVLTTNHVVAETVTLVRYREAVSQRLLTLTPSQ